jgi:hypothetical protein
MRSKGRQPPTPELVLAGLSETAPSPEEDNPSSSPTLLVLAGAPESGLS